eukprot:XP_011662398.1 PREDICTED: uncharacterized protein LOC105437471 [Strongylocentrotus purpuratus]
MESREGVKQVDFRPHEYTSQPIDDEGQIIESVHHISSTSAPPEKIPVLSESRDDLSKDTDVIRLEKYGIEVRIPPNQAYRAKDVTVEPIFDIPPGLALKETEAIISFGLRMSPSDATFDIPVTVTMPHCGIFTRPEAAKVVTYYRKSASDSFTAIPSSNGSPRCVVRHRDLDVYMDHFSEFWIVALITWVFIGKRVICTPFIPVLTPRNAKHVMFVHVRDENIEEKVQYGYMAPITGEQFLVKWRSGGLRITCNESTPMEDEVTTLQESEIRHLTEHKVMYTVDTRATDTNEVILHFIMKQSTTKQLLVPMHLVEEITETSLGDTVTTSSRPSPSTSAAIPVQDASAAAEKEHSKQAIVAWMESREGVKQVDFRPHEYTSQPIDDEGQIIESVHHIFSTSAPPEKIPVLSESRDDLSEDTDVIRLEKYGIEVRIPPNQAYRAKDVTVEPIFDIPPGLALKETEAIISFGLRMSPSDATFEIPVTVTMPHCGIFTRPEAAKVVTYYRKSASDSFTAIPSSNGSPRCVVRHRDLDVYMDHFSEFWIVALITWVFIGKRVICTPFIPVLTPRNAKHVMFVHVRDENIEEKVQYGYMAPITGEQFLVKWRSGGLRITCDESTPMEDEVTVTFI